jgi:hypothetical protein
LILGLWLTGRLLDWWLVLVFDKIFQTRYSPWENVERDERLIDLGRLTIFFSGEDEVLWKFSQHLHELLRVKIDFFLKFHKIDLRLRDLLVWVLRCFLVD